MESNGVSRTCLTVKGMIMMNKLLGYLAKLIKSATLPVLMFLTAQLGSAASAPPLEFKQINENGFGDCLNSYAWSMAWFKGNLYVGTNRGSFLGATGDFTGTILPDITCSGNDFAAEIWRYTPETKTWERVFKSPVDIPVVGRPGEFTARDAGFRDMIVFEEEQADGTKEEVLYIGGVVYPGVYPGTSLNARLLRSEDGETFAPVPQTPGTFFGDLGVDSFRAFAAYKGHLYVTAGSVLGEGVILESKNPASGNFRQVSSPDMIAFELAVYNDALYVGSAERLFTGFSVLKTTVDPNTATPPYNFQEIVTDGAYGYGIVGPNNAVLSMDIFQDKLYVGGQTDLVRIDKDDTWELVVGNPRFFTPQGSIFPISGLPSGFGNLFTGHLWRMEEHEGWLYVGTWDTAVFVRNILGPFADMEAGFDLWATPDGISWYQLTRDGFGNPFNHGVRSLESAVPYGLFLGSVNPWDGTQVFLGQKTNTSVPTGSLPDTNVINSLLDFFQGLTNVWNTIQFWDEEKDSTGALPGMYSVKSQHEVEPLNLEGLIKTQSLKAIRHDLSTVSLSWISLVDAAQFDVYRAVYTSNREIGATAQVPCLGESDCVWTLEEDAWLPGPYEKIGTSANPSFTDSTAMQGTQYAYYVQAVGPEDGQPYDKSNIVVVMP